MPIATAKLKPSKPKQLKPWHYIGSSVLVWLLIALLTIDYAIYTLRPLKHVKATQYLPLDQNPVVSKIPEFFESSIKPDALVLGSSLPMTAIAYCDYQYKGEPDATKIGQVRVYTKARYLQDNLTRIIEPLNIFNLSCYGCMASEAYLLLSRAIDDGRKPKYVFYGIAPRDFVDNTVPAVGKTPVYEVLSDWRCVNDIFTRNLQLPQIGDLFAGYIWYYYRVKADYRTFLTAASCDFFNRPATLFEATTRKAAPKEEIATPIPTKENGSICTALESQVSAAKPKWDDNSAEYKSRYNPANFQRYAQELSYFERLAKLCQEKQIKLVVFNMPLMDKNKNLLDKKLYDNYLTDTRNFTQKSGGTYLNLDTPGTYSQSDYLDSAHLNAVGGKKLQDNLISGLGELNKTK
ncbi:MAG: DUF1574 domain-containing protein [Candidatus Obscuribacterales bacterium]|nr:DUF1574 domain-containing protein [Candidatus Obscuribacterales bacterium]